MSDMSDPSIHDPASTSADSAPTLVEFLTARLDEDEHVALRPGGWGRSRWVYDRETFRVLAPDCTDGGTAVAARRERGDDSAPLLDVDGTHIARHDPARVLAEVAAKRAIVEWADARPPSCNSEHPLFDVYHPDGHGPHELLRLLALPFAAHPGYREEWRP